MDTERQKLKMQAIRKRGRHCEMCKYHVPKPNPLFLQRINYQKPETEKNVILLCFLCRDKWKYPKFFADTEKIKEFKQKVGVDVKV